ELEDLRDQVIPARLNSLRRVEVMLGNWSERSEENARRARKTLFTTQNSRKAYIGRLEGLLDPDLVAAKARSEAEFKSKLAARPECADALAAYARIADATKTLAAQATRFALLEGGEGFSSDTYRIARTLLRAGDERPKPNGERLREFSDSGKA